ncbi:hypothetical protein B9G69_002435 [Bdellovibrio sp. SKB1291214]|uniref:hypothetical protein n=1 Tax=Bdellovibrio sp. SKB1291214 TaxID=1732569 RepID=UPI000B516C39|nr:hypothetical protein [Bdellovibrio sp. SKB1291214]UYL09430.1 hypothetical protein B9G69_002435 [Bdellovibrio sp. SKB1291214]
MGTLNLKLILATAAICALAACSTDSGISCDDRLCNTYTDLAIDQSDVTGQDMAAYSSGGGLHSMALLGDVLSLTPTLTLVGTLAPPTVNGAQVQASDIAVSGSKVYVAYNTRGATQAGAIDVIDISNPYALTLPSQALYPTSDIHKVYVKGTSLYAAGATSDNGGGGNLQKITLDANGKLTSTVSSVFLRSAADPTIPAYAGTSVVAAGSYIYALSGNNGGLSILNNSDLSTVGFTALPDARDISFDSSSSSLYAVTGKTASAESLVKHYDLNGSLLSSGNVTLSNGVIDEAKSTITTGATFQIATNGYGGARLICLSSGAILGTATNPTVTGLTTDKTTANAAAFGAGYMFVANGEAGVTIYSVNTSSLVSGCSLVTITYLGRFSLGANASANNIFYTNGHLVVATGQMGFKIVKVTTSVLSGLVQAL